MTTLLLTRPEGQNRPLAEAAAARGWHSRVLPLFRAVACDDVAARQQRLQAHGEDDWWIFTSPRAVALAVEAAPARWPALAAIGAATAEALRAAGQRVAAVPAARYDSESLLALDAFADVSGRRIAIVGNAEGRGFLQQQLAQRGAEVHTLGIYALQPVAHDADTVAAAVRAADLLLLTSAGAAQRLHELLPQPSPVDLAGLPLVVPSPRVAAAAQALGFTGPHAVAQPMSPHALLAAADTLLAMEEDKKTAERDNPASAPSPESDTPTDRPADSPADAGGSAASAAPAGPAAGAPPGAADAGGRRRGNGLALFVLLLVLVLAGALAGSAWWGMQQLQSLRAERAELVSLVEAERERAADSRSRLQAVADLAEAADARSRELAEQSQWQAERLDELTRIVDAGRERAHRLAAEQLLQQANERLLLARDVAAADQALRLADERLAALGDPRFLPVRQRIAEERAALAALDQADRTALSLRLAALIRRSDGLRLRGGVPDPHAPQMPQASADADAGQPPWQRALDAVGDALGSVFVVRRTDIPVQPLMAPDQEPLVRGVLLLRLEAARVALLAGDTEGYREALAAAGQWLDAQYATADAPVKAALREVRDLGAASLSPALPDISGSLTRFREVQRRADRSDTGEG